MFIICSGPSQKLKKPNLILSFSQKKIFSFPNQIKPKKKKPKITLKYGKDVENELKNKLYTKEVLISLGI